MMKNCLECLRTEGFMARQDGDAAASGLLVYDKAGQGLIVLWQMKVGQLFQLSALNVCTWQAV